MGGRAPWYAPLKRAGEAAVFFFCHILIASVLIGCIEIIRLGLKALGNPLLFDRFPVRYIFDAMDFGILVVFGFFGVIGAWAVLKNWSASHGQSTGTRRTRT